MTNANEVNKIDTLGYGEYFLNFFNKKVEKFKGITIETQVFLIGKEVVLKTFISTHIRYNGDKSCSEEELESIKKEYGIRTEVIGQIPFIPTIVVESGSPGCTWYKVKELSEKDNESLNLCYSWNGGKSYSKKWNQDSKYSWCSFFFKDYKID